MLSEKLAEKLSGSLLLKIQTLAALILLFAVMVASFGGMAKMQTGVETTNADAVAELVERGLDSGRIPDRIDVGIGYVLASVGGIGEYLKLGGDGDLTDLKTGTVRIIAFTMAVKHSFAESPVLGMCNIALIGMSFILPLVMFIRAIAALIVFFKNSDDQAEAFVRVSGKFNAMFSSFAMVLALGSLIPGVALGSGLISILVLSFVGYAINIAASRLKYYEMSDFIYLTVWQGAALIGITGFAVFMISISASGFVREMVASLGKYALVGAARDVAFLPVFLVVLAVMLVINICDHFVQLMMRVSCSASAKKYSNLMAMIKTSIHFTAFLLIPIILHLSSMPFVIDKSNITAFIFSVIGVLIMLAAEVAYMVVTPILCPEADEDGIEEITGGTYTGE